MFFKVKNNFIKNTHIKKNKSSSEGLWCRLFINYHKQKCLELKKTLKIIQLDLYYTHDLSNNFIIFYLLFFPFIDNFKSSEFYQTQYSWYAR